MPPYIITPWRFHSELLQVRRELFQLGDAAFPVDHRRRAMDLVGAWKMRGNLPHSVESTAQLVEAILHHDAKNHSIFSIQATYAAAFCRFVTGFCDIEQNSMIKRSMFEVGRILDMPASFIELRHEATHGELPSLQRLERHAKLALDWLWQYYWAKLDVDTSPLGTKSAHVVSDHQLKTVGDAIRVILAAFLSTRRHEIKKDPKCSTSSSASESACLELIKICRGYHSHLETLTTVLIEEKMLIPAARLSGSSMEGAFVIWGNLLRRLCIHQRRFLKLLLARMSHVIIQFSHLALHLDVFREAISDWIRHIFSSKLWSQPKIRQLVWSQRSYVVNECIMNPNCWSTPLAKRLVADGGADFKEQWLPLLDIIDKG